MATKAGRAVVALATTTIGLLSLAGAAHEAGAVTPSEVTYSVLRNRAYDLIALSGDLSAILLTDVSGRSWGNRVERIASGASIPLPTDEEGLLLDRTGGHALVAGGGGLRVRTVATGAERTVDTTTPVGDGLLVDAGAMAIAADGSSVVFSTFSGATLRQKLWFASGTKAPVEIGAGLPATQLNSVARTPALSADGRYVVFVWADYLAGCTSGGPFCLFEVVRYDTRTGERMVVSLTPAGTETAGIDSAPAVSADGHLVVWFTDALDVAPGLTTARTRLVARDVARGTTAVLATSDDTSRLGVPAVSDDGRRVAVDLTGPVNFGGTVLPASTVRVIDRVDGTVLTLGPIGRVPDAVGVVVGLSPDGTRVAFRDAGIGVLPPPGIDGPLLSVATVPRTDLPAPGSTPVVPERLLDTRSGLGWSGGKPAAGAIVELQVTGAGTTAVPGDATAVLLNVTATEATADGYITVWPCGSVRPTASNLNVAAGRTVPNLVAVKLGAGGKVCLFTQSGTHLLADVAAWYPAGAAFTPVVPERLLDTRTGLGSAVGKPAAGATVELQVTGAGTTAVPTDARTVVLNVTATEATADGYVTVWPCGSVRPTASNLNLVAGETAPNLVSVGLGPDGTVCLFTQSGAHLLADVAGYER